MQGSAEWVVFLGLLLVAVVALLWRAWRGSVGWIAVSLVALAIGSAWRGDRLRAERRDREATRRAEAPRREDAGDRVSSDTCRACHPGEYHSWHRSFHRTMTQYAYGDAVRGDFGGGTVEVDGVPHRLEREADGSCWVETVDPDWIHDRALAERDALLGRREPLPEEPDPPRVRRRVTLTTGSHHFQAYWVASEKREGVQFALPITWFIREGRWIPRKDAFVQDPSEPSPIQIWNVNCIKCHATGATPARRGRSNHFDTRVVEMGIGCEACHGPGREHVEAHRGPAERYLSRLDGRPDDTIGNPARLGAVRSSEVCGQCHSVAWTRDSVDWMNVGYAFRPGDDLSAERVVVRPSSFAGGDGGGLPAAVRENARLMHNMFWPDGVVRVTGREYNGLLESACHRVGELSCLSCHSMHDSDPDGQLATGMRGDRACLQCHGAIGADIAAHTRHAPESSGSRCYNCHMPYDTYGLLKAVRSHTIRSPDVAVEVETGRPNACNLCHVDRTLTWTARHLSDWYGHPERGLPEGADVVSEAVRGVLSGDAARRVLYGWALGWEEARRASGGDWQAPFLEILMRDSHSALRYVGYRALTGLPGFSDIEFDFVGPEAERERVLEEVVRRWQEDGVADDAPARPEVLMNTGGRVDGEAVTRLLEIRDTRPVTLVE